MLYIKDRKKTRRLKRPSIMIVRTLFPTEYPQNKAENEETHFADVKATHEHPTDIVRSQTPPIL
jgi:hypothetical protein